MSDIRTFNSTYVLALLMSITFLNPPGAVKADTSPFREFAGIEWGSQLQSIKDRWGNPSKVTLRGDTIRKLTYRNIDVLSPRSTLVFFVHDTRGLIKGGYEITLRGETTCEQSFITIRNSLDKRYSRFPFREVKFDSSFPRGNFCDARSEEHSGWEIVWTDEKKTARVQLSLSTKRNKLYVRKFSQRYLTSRNRPNARQTEKTSPQACKKLAQFRTITALQRHLRAMGADIRVDGLWGTNTARSLLKLCPDSLLHIELVRKMW